MPRTTDPAVLPKPILTRPLNGGTQKLYRFANGYGASHITGPYVFGENEVAVTRYTGERADDYSLCYDTPITDDVLGHLTDAQVRETLEAIAALPATEAA